MIEKLEHGALLRSFPLAASITGAPPDPIRALAGLTNACTVCSVLRTPGRESLCMGISTIRVLEN
jgi:hypothetical protein